MMNVRAPADCQLPGGSADKLAASLFPGTTRSWYVDVQADPSMPQHGVKTKLQMQAERSVRPPSPTDLTSGGCLNQCLIMKDRPCRGCTSSNACEIDLEGILSSGTSSSLI